MILRCISRLSHVNRPIIRLFLFHCAGGSHLFFRNWNTAFPVDWELCAIEAPGRGRLADAKPAEDAAGLSDFVMEAITPWLDMPFAFFGHSMGGLLAFDIAMRLRLAGLPGPKWLGVSARQAPGSVLHGARALPHTLPDDLLKEALLEMGGTPPSILNDHQLWALMVPVLRADLRFSDTWRRPPLHGPIDVPLSAFGGTDDPFTPLDRLAAWKEQTTTFVGLHHFAGGHFYNQHHFKDLARRIVADVEVVRGTAPSP